MENIEAPTANPQNLLNIVRETYDAKVVLPEFQRPFIWSREDIEEALSSILHGYFVGTFLMLDTPSGKPMFFFRWVEGLDKVNDNIPQHQIVRLILDGQQRITSLFYALYQPDISLHNSKNPYKFFLRLDVAMEGDIDEAVVGISTHDRRRMAEINQLVESHQALSFRIFNDPSSFYRWLYNEQNVWNDADRKLIESLYRRFTEFMIPVVNLPYNTGKDNIINIFERINRTGISLSLFDLAVARLCINGVNLKSYWIKFTATRSEATKLIKPEFLLKLIAVLRGLDPRKANLLDMLDSFNKNNFDDIWNSAVIAIDSSYERITKKYGVLRPDSIPYTTMIVPLAAMLSKLEKLTLSEKDYRKIDSWYWSNVFSQRYDSAVDTKVIQDVRDVVNWVNDGNKPDWIQKLADKELDINVEEPRSAIYKGIMCLIAHQSAKDFISGLETMLHECQDDHIFPQSVYRNDFHVDTILNRTLISKSTNTKLKRAKHPSKFFAECLVAHGNSESNLLNTLDSHFISPTSYEFLKKNDFENFILEREKMLNIKIKELIAGA